MFTDSEEIECWVESDGEIDEYTAESKPPCSPEPLLPDSPPQSKADSDVKNTVWWIVAFLSLFQTLHFISDKAISWLIRFLCVIIRYLAKISQAPQISRVADELPRSFYMKDKYLGNDLYLNM